MHITRFEPKTIYSPSDLKKVYSLYQWPITRIIFFIAIYSQKMMEKISNRLHWKKKPPIAQMLKEEEEYNLKFLLSKLAYNKYAAPYTWRHYFDTLHFIFFKTLVITPMMSNYSLKNIWKGVFHVCSSWILT
jgi:hypothetical protein